MKDFLWRRRMRRRARKEMRGESTVWQEYKKNRSSALRRWINTELNSGLSGMVVVLILTAFAVNAEPKPYRMLLAFSFLGTSIILFRSAALFGELFQSAARSTMFAMPISDRDYLSLQLRRYSKKSISTFLYFLICYGVALDQIGRTDFFWRFGIPAALMQACLAVALTILILRFPILLYKGWSTTVTFLAAMAAVWAPADAIRSLWSLSLVSPVAWVNLSFIGFFGVGNSYSRYLMFAAVAILALAWREYLRTFESTAATLELQAADIADVSLPTFTASEATDEEFESSEAPSTSYSVETRQVATPLTDATRIELSVPEWRSQSWLDRLVFSTLTKRELILAELMLGAKRTSFTGAYVSAVAIAAVGFILCFIPSAPASMLFWPLIIAAIVGTPLVGGRWIGFEGPVNVGIKLPIFALFPVSYWQLSVMMFKIIAVRLLVFAPIPILYAAPLNVRMGGDPVGGLLTALKLVFLAFAFQPIAVALHFSSRSNDTRQLKWSIIILLAAVLAILVALVTCFIIAITANSILVRLLAWVAIAALSLAIWAGYGWFFNRGRFDVLETPKN